MGCIVHMSHEHHYNHGDVVTESGLGYRLAEDENIVKFHQFQQKILYSGLHIADYITLHTLFLLPPYIFYVSESGYMWTENMIAHLRPPMTNNQNKKTHLSYMYVTFME